MGSKPGEVHFKEVHRLPVVRRHEESVDGAPSARER